MIPIDVYKRQMIYNTTEEVRAIATDLLRISALLIPVHAFTNASYFTLRSGGKTMLTFAFDSGFVWAICIPTAFCLSRFTGLAIRPLYAIVQGVDILKCILGFICVRSNIWLNNIVGGGQAVEAETETYGQNP